jgi:hypothetical protein
VKRGALAVLILPCLAACGALIGAEWDATLKSTVLDGAPGGDDADTEQDGSTGDGDAADSSMGVDAFVPGTCGGKLDHCFCTAHVPKEDGVVCSIKAQGGGADFCCADKSWPITGKCQCATYNCVRDDPDYCMCSSAKDAGTPSSCSGPFCCYSPDIASCSCYGPGTFSCPAISAHEVQVATCTLSTIPCGATEKRVESCGVVTP